MVRFFLIFPKHFNNIVDYFFKHSNDGNHDSNCDMVNFSMQSMFL